MPRGHPGPTVKPPASDNKPGEKRKLKPRGKPFEKGNRNGGRPKGSPNKISRDLKEAYLMAANLAGGEEGLVGYLKTQALQSNPSPFMPGLAKLLPLMLEATKISSGAREGRKIGVMFSGTLSLPSYAIRRDRAAGKRGRLKRHCVRYRRGEAASCRCPRRARREPRRHREPDRSRRTDRHCRSAGQRAVCAAFHAGPTGERGRSSDRSGPRPGTISRRRRLRQTIEMS